MSESFNLPNATVAPAGGGRFGVGGRSSGAAAVPVQSGVGATNAQPTAAAQQGAAAQAQDREAIARQVAAAVENLKKYAEKAGSDLSFRVDDDTGHVVVSVVDRNDGTVLRQMPTEEALRISRALAEFSDSQSAFVDAVA